MNILTTLIAMIVLPLASDHSQGLEALAFMSGDWDAVFETFADTWGEDGAGTAEGYVTAGYGPGDAWFEMQAGTSLAGSGAYAVKVIVFADGRSGLLRAFVVNSFNSGATYEGRVTPAGEIAFETRIGEKIQRVTYERHDDRVRYVAQESYDDGATWERHTEAWWTRVGEAIR